jgi:hypothetical protein
MFRNQDVLGGWARVLWGRQAKGDTGVLTFVDTTVGPQTKPLVGEDSPQHTTSHISLPRTVPLVWALE